MTRQPQDQGRARPRPGRGNDRARPHPATPLRSRRTSLVLWLAVAAALALIAAGCASQAAEGERLEDFLGAPGVGMPDEEQQRQVEERVAECMAEEGFEYTPRDPRDPEDPPGGLPEHPREKLDEDEFREEYGYGISTWRPEPDEEPAPSERDPNFERMKEMDDAEREAYQKALHGEGFPTPIGPGDRPHEDEGGDEADDSEAPEPGCRQKAREAVLGDQREAREELHSDLSDLREAVESDPRIAEVEQQWATCMRERGWDVSDRHEAQQLINEEQREVMDMPEPAEMQEMREAADGEFEPPKPDVDEEALEELQERELELAADDHECAESHDLEDVREEVRAEHEQEFIEEHRDTLEQMRD